jgi:hypothetical protein
LAIRHFAAKSTTEEGRRPARTLRAARAGEDHTEGTEENTRKWIHEDEQRNEPATEADDRPPIQMISHAPTLGEPAIRVKLLSERRFTADDRCLPRANGEAPTASRRRLPTPPTWTPPVLSKCGRQLGVPRELVNPSCGQPDASVGDPATTTVTSERDRPAHNRTPSIPMQPLNALQAKPRIATAQHFPAADRPDHNRISKRVRASEWTVTTVAGVLEDHLDTADGAFVTNPLLR